ncbi:hypothetical protein N665_0022s0021 [Sinapis alba]|nr:hypothetical protein N665_0022s0021 [Sinapis alba]
MKEEETSYLKRGMRFDFRNCYENIPKIFVGPSLSPRRAKPAGRRRGSARGERFSLPSCLSYHHMHAIVEELAGFGVTIHTCARDEAHLNECLSKWKNKGFQVTGSVCDASSWTEREKLMQTVYSLFDAKLTTLYFKVVHEIFMGKTMKGVLAHMIKVCRSYLAVDPLNFSRLNRRPVNIELSKPDQLCYRSILVFLCLPANSNDQRKSVGVDRYLDVCIDRR